MTTHGNLARIFAIIGAFKISIILLEIDSFYDTFYVTNTPPMKNELESEVNIMSKSK